MKRGSILKKMLIGISIPIVVVLAATAALISVRVGGMATNDAKQKLSSDSLAASWEVSDFFTAHLAGATQAAGNYQVESILKSTQGAARLSESPEYPNMKITLDRSVNVDPENILASWIGDFDTSQITQSDGFTSAPGWDITGRPWYRVKETGAAMLTEPYIDASTGELIVTAAAPVSDHETGEIIGACGYDIELSQLTATMKNYRIGENGILILCTENGLIIHHPDETAIQKNITETNCSDNVKQAFQSGASGSFEYTVDGVPYSGTMNPIGTTGWNVLTGLPEDEILAASDSVTAAIAFIFLLGVLLLIGIIALVSRGISRPMKKLAAAANRIADGDLDVDVQIHTHDETGRVAEAISRTVSRLKDYILYIDEITNVLNQVSQKDLVFDLKQDYAGEFSRVKEALLRIRQTLTATIGDIAWASEQVSSGSSQVASSAQALSQGATEQASAVEELDATIAKVSEQISQNAGSAQDANGKIQEVSKELSNSNQKMRELTGAMQGINQSAGEIGKIIKTIEDIAFQTNILALNAAVEAARAGTAGKGFAVVADEVRNLANKSGEAAKETTALIESSVRAIGGGTKIAEDAADSIDKVAEHTRNAVNAIQEIASATKEQAEAIAQVTQGMDQISSVVQANSATAEQSAATSEQLSGQALNLKELVDQFHLSASTQAPSGR